MTWDLAESGKHFITTLINGSDLVPTFSTASIDDLRFEVLYLFLFSGKESMFSITSILNDHSLNCLVLFNVTILFQILIRSQHHLG